MAKLEKHFIGDFDTVLKVIHDGLMGGSMSISYEGGSDFEQGGVRYAVRVYERFSMLGNNRVSMNVTLFASADNLFLSAITAGGSQAVFFKINTFGEEAFLECLESLLQGLT